LKTTNIKDKFIISLHQKVNEINKIQLPEIVECWLLVAPASKSSYTLKRHVLQTTCIITQRIYSYCTVST